MWDDGVIDLSLKKEDRFFLHPKVRMGCGWSWELTALYASPNPSIVRYL